MRTKTLILVTLAPVLLSLGCAHTQLRIGHVEQAKTLSTIHEQQVLDNIAMFHKGESAIPFFAFPNAGSAQITDNTSLGANTLNGPLGTVLGPLGLSRNNTQRWVMEPVSDERKLRAMRELYLATIPHLSIKNFKKKTNFNPCKKIGTYCDCAIEVCPESHQLLTELTLQVIGIARSTAPKAKPVTPKPSIQVTDVTYDEDGKPIRFQVYSTDTSGAIVAAPTSANSSPTPVLREAVSEQVKELYRENLFRN